ncbi:FFLEELY motif protein [Alteromonas oceanisediminis]|uniref:FFLEELY motif protein n=1 Tax=Alteromonas oceanisediminis TaxID=2836180 RepID=UPI001BDB1099|nr:hypothetical protein [Alteromonas oceanisediminis]MBT0587438.1 hypothetical protein [Alteromonas oceanisediminis]
MKNAVSLTSDHIIQHIHKVNARRDLAQKMGRLEAVHALQEWQCRRLLTTHADLQQEPEFADAMTFFVDELYGPKDFSQRDKDLSRVIPKLSSVLPEKALNALNDALRLNALSFDLDLDMVNAMVKRRNADIKSPSDIDTELYANAYRDVGRCDDRATQIDIVDHLGMLLADVVKVRGISMLIKLARKPAKVAGVLTLHEFLERGFAAFKQLGDVRDFLDPIVDRERHIMRVLCDDSYSPEKNPLPDEPIA